MLQANTLTLVLFAVAFTALVITWLILWSEHSGPRKLDWLAAIFAAVIGGIVIVGWVGVVLATFGFFSLTLLSILVLMVAGAVLWRQRPLKIPLFDRPGHHEIVLLLLLVGCAVVYFRPHEYVLGSTDAGGYMNIGATLARTGAFIIEDEWTPFLREHAGITLRQQPAAWRTEYLQFVGWYIDDNDASRIIPQFFPFHPVLVAVGIALAGLYGGLLVTPLWGVLSLAAVYLLGKEAFDRNVGLLAAVLLALTATHIYFARYPTTEPLTLLLVFAGLWAFQRMWDEPGASPVWGIFGGATLGAAFLTRIDLPLVALLLIIFLFLRFWQGKRSPAWTAFTFTFTLLLAHATFSALFLNWPYTWNTYSSVFRLFIRSPLVTAGSATVALLLLATTAILRWNSKLHLSYDSVERLVQARWSRLLLAWLVVLLSAYAYFLRPTLEPITTYQNWIGGSSIPILNGQNWVRMGWYLTPLGLLLATLGVVYTLQREQLLRLGFFLSVGILTTIQYVTNILNTPYHIYAMRRYVPIVIPMLMIYAAVTIVALWRLRPFWAGRLGALVLALTLGAGLVYQARFVLPQRDFFGAVDQLAELNERLKPDALIIISEPADSLFADTFGPPLRYIYGHDVATIRRDEAGVLSFIEETLSYAAERGRPLQLIAVEPVLPTVRQNLSLQPVTMVPVWLYMLMNTFDDYPSVIQTVYYGIEVYDVKTDSNAKEAWQPVEIDIGTLDTIFIRSGFYDKEPLPGPITMRWTAAEAVLDVPLPDTTPVTIEVRAMIFQPDSELAGTVNVWLDGQNIGHFEPDETWQTFSFQAQPNPAQGITRLEFKTSTFNPAALQINNDTRDLGFLLDWIRITTGE